MNGNPADKGKNGFNFSPDIIEQIEALLADADAEDTTRTERKKQGETEDAEIETLFEGLDLASFGTNAGKASLDEAERSGAVEVRERVPMHPALARFDGLDTEAAERFVGAREAYFAAYAEHVRDGRPRHESSRLLRTKAAYREARKVIADRVLGSRMRTAAQEDDGWKHELLTAWEAEELNALWETGEQAVEKKSAGTSVPPNAAIREAKPSRKILRAGLLAALAPLLAQTVPMANAPEVPTRAKPVEEPVASPDALADEKPVAIIKVSVPATKKGPNEMLLKVFKQLKEQDPTGQVYAKLAGDVDAKPIDAALALSDALGFQKRENDGVHSAIVHRGEKITLDANGDLVYIISPTEQHALTEDGKPLVQDWLKYDAP